MPAEQSNTFKFSTFIYIVLGLIVPLWPFSLPFFWYLAYKSYKRGVDTIPNATHVTHNPSAMEELEKAAHLRDQGLLSEDEFQQIKRKALGLSDSFVSILGIDDTQDPKPGIHGFRRLQAHYPLIAEHCLFIGDSDATDGAFCRQLGMPFINITTMES